MAYLRTDGIITRVVNVGEADRIVTIFSGSHGKLQASARGSRRPKSRIIAGGQFLCYGRFLLYKGRGLYSINSFDVIESFYGIRNDLVKLTYASHMVEMVNDVIQEDLPAPGTLKLFLNTLHILLNTERKPELVTRIFELRLLTLLGYAPDIYGCVVCGKPFENGGVFDFENDGIICSRCRSGQGKYSLNQGSVKAMQHIMFSSQENLFKFCLSSELLNEINRVMERYVSEKLEKRYSKLDYLKNISH